MIRAIAVGVLIMVIAAALWVALSLKAKPQPIICVSDDETRERTRMLMLNAIDQAFQDHVMHLYDVMMKAGGDPQRAATGTRQGLKAYLAGRTALLKWNPPLC